MPLSVALLAMVILNYKEIHGAPFEVPGRRERLSRGDRDKLGGGGNERGSKCSSVVEKLNMLTHGRAPCTCCL